MGEVELPRYDVPITIYTTFTKVLGYVVRYTVPTVVRTVEGFKPTYSVVTEITYYLGGRGGEVVPEVLTKLRRVEVPHY